MPKKYHVALDDHPRRALEARRSGPLALRRRNRVDVLLRADAGETDVEVAEGLGISVNTVAGARKRFDAEGLDAAPAERPRKGALRSSTASRRPPSSPWRAARPRTARPAGRSAAWPGGPSSWRSWSRSRARPCGAS